MLGGDRRQCGGEGAGDLRGGHRERETLRAPVDEGHDADDLAGRIDDRAARVSVVDVHVDLEERGALELARDVGHDAAAEGEGELARHADGEHLVARAEVARVAEPRRWHVGKDQARRLHEREVALNVARHHRAPACASRVSGESNRVHILHHMVAGENEATMGVEENPRPIYAVPFDHHRDAERRLGRAHDGRDLGRRGRRAARQKRERYQRSTDGSEDERAPGRRWDGEKGKHRSPEARTACLDCTSDRGSLGKGRAGTCLAFVEKIVAGISEQGRDTIAVLRQLGFRRVAGAILRRATAEMRAVVRSIDSRPAPASPAFVEALRKAPSLLAGSTPLPEGPALPREPDERADPRIRWEAARGARLVELAARRDPELDGALRAFLAQIEDDDPLETALRLWNLAVVVSLVGPRALSDEAAAELAATLVASARNVEIQLEDRGLVVGTHLVGELVALHACGALLGAAGGETDAWRARARAALAREARVQVLPDGGGAEGSTGYARFVAELWIAALCCGRSGGERP